MAAYSENIEQELSCAKQALEYIVGKDVPAKGEQIGVNTCFVTDWVSENLPLEGKEGNALEELVRRTACDACYNDDVPPMPKEPPMEKEEILVFCDQRGYCNKIFDKVPEARIGTKKMVTKPPGLLTKEDIEALVGTKTWDLIVYGCALDLPKSKSVADVLDKESEIFKALLLLNQVIYRKEGCCNRFAALSLDIFNEEPEVHKKRGISHLSGSGLNGYCNTLRQEYEFPVQLIDIESTDDRDIIPYVATELFRKSTFGFNNVKLCSPSPIKNGRNTGRPSGRYVWRQYMSPSYEKAQCKFEVPEEGVVGISGGNGALGLVMGEWLLDWAEKEKALTQGKYTPKFQLKFLSRSTKVSDLNMQRWKDIERRGGEMGIKVEQSKLDMSTQQAVDTWVSEHTPNLIGFIHSAGILQDSMIPNQSWEKFSGVFDSKHRPALWFHDALERFNNPNLKFYWMFSSVAVNGSMGQLNYSTSNSHMDQLARHRRAMGKPAVAMQWGAWGEVGMAATMDEAMRRRVMMGPMPYFTVKQGIAGMEAGLRTGMPVFSVFIENPPMMFGWLQSPDPRQAFNRCFMGEYIPVSYGLPPDLTKESAYWFYRMYRYIFNPMEESESIVWNKYIVPRLAVEDKKEEEEPLVVGSCF
mmetsp:Transcript_72633/g.155564  ORF Transcript_72633/g.155564 Transcript_72633/m.155564 type:complete len:640 (-) Transcript_72633:405-2324(-)